MRDTAQNLLLKMALKQRVLDVTTHFAAFKKMPIVGIQNPSLCSPAVLQLCKGLESLGAGFAVFGRYLASRVDLFPVQDCFALSQIVDLSPETMLADICGVFDKELGRGLDECYAAFDAEPFESRTLYQLHRAQLHSGRDVTVKVVHPNVVMRVGPDREALTHLQGVFASLGWSGDLFAQTLAHFDAMLVQQFDVIRECDALKTLEHDIVDVDMCRAPVVYPALCSPHILTVERLPGWRLDHFLTQLQADEQMPSLVGSKEHRQGLVRQFCRAWLDQVFHKRLYPVTPYDNHLVVLSDGQVAFTGGRFARLPMDVQENLWDYLVSALGHDPERACRCLLREMDAQKGAADLETLSHLFRQVVPFRDGGWGAIGHQDTLSEHLFVHWRLAIQNGYRPRPWLLDFFRGLFLIASVGHTLAPDADPFKEALVSYREKRGWAQFQDAFDMERWTDALDKYAASFSELPQKVDDLLNRANDDDFKLKFRVREGAEHRQERNTSAVAISLLLVLVAIALLVYHLSPILTTYVWIKPLSAVVFAFVGGILLWVLTRTKI